MHLGLKAIGVSLHEIKLSAGIASHAISIAIVQSRWTWLRSIISIDSWHTSKVESTDTVAGNLREINCPLDGSSEKIWLEEIIRVESLAREKECLLLEWNSDLRA